jgi:hypothetical protein
MLTEAGATANNYAAKQAGGWDGGLPRHALLGYVSGGLSLDTQNRLDFSKNIEIAQPVYFPEIGTDMEKVSMAYHSVRMRPSAKQNLAAAGGGVIPDAATTPVKFTLNGAPPVPGAPFHDPCIDDNGDRLLAGVVGDWFDGDGQNNPAIPSTLNTKGRSNFSSRIRAPTRSQTSRSTRSSTRWGTTTRRSASSPCEDVRPTVNKQRPPEPLVMRFNTFDCGVLHANLVPHEFELTTSRCARRPTSSASTSTCRSGSHHRRRCGKRLELRGRHALARCRAERIRAINEFNELAGTVVPAGTLPGQLAPIDLTDLSPVPTIATGDLGGTVAGPSVLVAKPHPFFGGVKGNPQTAATWARAPPSNASAGPAGERRRGRPGLWGSPFSHDHYGPSTFQQIGLYSQFLSSRPARPGGTTRAAWRSTPATTAARPPGRRRSSPRTRWLPAARYSPTPSRTIASSTSR